MLKEFKTFITKGNMIDMAVGIIIGAAFSTVVKSLVEHIIMPPIGLLFGGVDFSNLFFVLNSSETTYNTVAAAKDAGEAVIAYGLFINNSITFLIVGYCVFILVKSVNKLKSLNETAVEKTTKTCKFCKSKINKDATKCPFCVSKV